MRTAQGPWGRPEEAERVDVGYEYGAIAATIFVEAGLAPGCDMRDLAYGLGLRVMRWAAPTRILAGALYYDSRLHPRERNARIAWAIAKDRLEISRYRSPGHISGLAFALCRRPSGSANKIA